MLYVVSSQAYDWFLALFLAYKISGLPWWLSGKRTHLPMQETQVQFLGREDPREKEMATHSNILAWRIPWTEEPGGLQSMGLQRIGHDRATNININLFITEM